MKFLVEHLKNLRELYVNQLQMLLSAEEQIAMLLATLNHSINESILHRVFL